MSEKNLVEFLLYIIPGFISIEFYRYFYPGKTLDKFSYVAWSLINGIFIYAIIKYIDTNWLSLLFNSSKSGFPDLKFIVALIFGSLVFGVIKITYHDIIFNLSNKHKNLRFLAPDSLSIWAKINYTTNNDWALVFLSDGSIYLGYIGEYRFDPNTENQDFLLKDAKRVDEDLNEKYLINGIGVYLNTKDVNRIEFLSN